MPLSGHIGATRAAIERLSFDEAEPHEPIEAAIHLGRYLLARGLCAGKVVLDVACGDGYGTHFMAARWGAARVHGIDISAEAIERATRLFGSDRATFHCKDIKYLGELFEPEQFDLVVSLETIEHVAEPAAFLRTIRRLLKPGGAVVISCPNDHWYYRAPGEGNPFHLRKYTFDEFRAMAEAALGPARRFMLGTPVTGFLNVDPSSSLLSRGGASRAAIFEAEGDVDAALLPTSETVSPANCSYFVGLWGPESSAATISAALVPCSMDQGGMANLRAAMEAGRDEVVFLSTKLHAAEREVAELRPALEGSDVDRCARLEAAERELRSQLAVRQRDLRDARLRLLAISRENQLIREETGRSREELIRPWRETERDLKEKLALLTLPENISFSAKLRWSISRMEPAFPRVIRPLKRAFRSLFLRA